MHLAGDDLEGLSVEEELAAGDVKLTVRGIGIGACTERDNDSENCCELKRSAQIASSVRDS